MPRTLPWLTGAGTTKRELSSPASVIKRTSSPRVKSEHEPPTRKETFTSKRDFLKSSPSPPSSPIHRCPSEEFLREGLDQDDIYMMVEDEFYSVAQSFTQHLHYAEYVRRKKEVKAQNAATIADIARPTDGATPMSDELKKKYAAEDLKTKQKEGIDVVLGKQARHGREEGAGDDIEAENSWAGTHLQDLMLSPRRVRSLVGLQKVKSSTRAAAGFSQSSGLRDDDGVARSRPGEAGKESIALEETTDDDDLDVGMGQATPTVETKNHGASSSRLLRPSPKLMQPTSGMDLGIQSPMTTKRNHISSSSGSLRHSPAMCPPHEKHSSEDTKELRATESKDTVSNTTQAKKRLIFDDFEELPELRKPSIQSEKRRPNSTNFKQKKFDDKDTGSKKSRLNEVPTFLI